MKKVNIISVFVNVFVFVIVFVVSACSLDREQYGVIKDSDVITKASDMELLDNGLMYYFSAGDWGQNAIYSADLHGYQVLSDMTTDALWCNSTWGSSYDQLYYHQWDNNVIEGTVPSNTYYLYGQYNFLTKADNVFDRIQASSVNETVSSEGESIDAKNLYSAEAKCLKGWMGYMLYDLFGPVPLATEEMKQNPTVSYPIQRATYAEYDTMMVQSLRYAIDNLPKKAARGRMTRGIAQMILMKYYMMRASSDVNPGYWQKALALCNNIINEGNYSLDTDYANVFTANANSDEVILSVPCIATSSWLANHMTAEILPSDMAWTTNSEGWGGYLMPWAFYDTFETDAATKEVIDKRALTCVVTEYTSTSNGKKCSRADESDPSKYPASNANTCNQFVRGALPLKYQKDQSTVSSNTNHELMIFRYADVLLSKAECLARLDWDDPTSKAAAIALVDQVRTRAGLSSMKTWYTDTYEHFMDGLLVERGHEFFLEGIRRSDLIRFGVYEKKANERIEKDKMTEYTEYPTGYHKFFPIPDTYIKEATQSGGTLTNLPDAEPVPNN